MTPPALESLDTDAALNDGRIGASHVAPRNIPKRGIPTFLSENIPADYKTTCTKIAELEEKLEQERTYKQYLEAIASAANISLG